MEKNPEATEATDTSEATEVSTPNLDDAVLVNLAVELHRLAGALKKDLQRQAVLPGLSDLTAMRPLQVLLTEALTARVVNASPGPDEESSPTVNSGTFPGYL